MIYLDNAATAFPKPPRVGEEMLRCVNEYGGNPGRGSHRLSLSAAEKIYECREKVASLFGCRDPMRVVFTSGATAAINTVVKGLLRPGDHVLLSEMEHNAVFRPIAKLQREGKITYDVFPVLWQEQNPSPERICAEIERRIRKNTRLLICTHTSNICSVTLPIAQIGALCRKKGVFFAVDGAQSAGKIPISVEEMKIDALCLPGHKGLMGPAGCGALILSENCRPDTLLEGGSGLYSLEAEMPLELPERYEAGTPPTPAIAGLLRGVEFLQSVGIREIKKTEDQLTARLRERLLEIPKLTIHLPHRAGGILLFSSPEIPSGRLGDALDERGFCVRAGFHCAALAHKAIGTPGEGAVRVSPGFFNGISEMDAFADAVKEILN